MESDMLADALRLPLWQQIVLGLFVLMAAIATLGVVLQVALSFASLIAHVAGRPELADRLRAAIPGWARAIRVRTRSGSARGRSGGRTGGGGSFGGGGSSGNW